MILASVVEFVHCAKGPCDLWEETKSLQKKFKCSDSDLSQTKPSLEAWPFLWGKREKCRVRALINLIDA